MSTINRIKISSVYLPLAQPISDAKVLTGRQKPMTEVAMLFVEIQTQDNHSGLGLSYAKELVVQGNLLMRMKLLQAF